MSDLQARFANIEKTLAALNSNLSRVSGRVGVKLDDIQVEVPKKEEPLKAVDVKAVTSPTVPSLSVVGMMQDLYAVAKKLDEVVIKNPAKLVELVESPELHALLMSVLSLIHGSSKSAIKALKQAKSGCYRCMHDI